MPTRNPSVETMLRYIRYLSVNIGGRGSCTAAESRAAEYLADQMQTLGVQNVRLELFKGAPSTYRPYALAFTAGLLGTSFVWLFGERWVYAIAALFNAMGAWGMLAETDFMHNWMRLLLPKGRSQNVVGIIPPAKDIQQQVVLCAHMDTHRTPIFYSSKTWQILFSTLVGGAFASMVISALLYLLGAIFSWDWVRWIGLLAAAMEIFALSMTLHADFTPFSPGANNGASGIGVVLALADRLHKEPLQYTQVWLVFTGCEEAASYGIISFIRRHTSELGSETVYINNDLVGAGRLNNVLKDGLIIKHKIHPVALQLVRQTRHELLHIPVDEINGIAYTDATPVTKHGLKAITIVANPPPGSKESTHWHQMSDTIKNIDMHTLDDAFTYTWQLLHIIDHKAAGRKE